MLKKGDFVILSYTAKVKETGEVFDTTDEEVAKTEKIHKEGELYEPKLVVLGEKWVLEALDESLVNLEIGKKTTVEIPPEKAFGLRDPEKVRLVPLRRLTARGITPKLGLRIEYNDKPATVRTVGAGRVQLDFNPPLSGKTLIYELVVQKKIGIKKGKLNALLHRRVPAVDIEKFTLKIGKTFVTVNMPEESFYVEGVQLVKRGFAMDVSKFFPQVTSVKFIETFKFKKGQ